ncbi:MAG TPA: hypothetical protein VM053_03460 [Gemmatimonadaceae bacterium]|nr:hypothetical protein [Gemmatimonadaceae bacterium]
MSGKTAAGDTRTLVVLAGVVAITIGGVYWILRTGFENPPAPIVKSVALSLFLIAFPLIARTLVVRTLSADAVAGWAASYPFLWLAGIGVTGLVGRLVPVAGFNPFLILAVVGVTAYVLTLVRWIVSQGILRSIGYIAAAALFGIWTAGVVWGRIYLNPLFFEKFIVDGTVHHDTLNLAALGNMLRTYHVASTGIDGLNYFPYHWGSPWLFVQFANLVDIDVMRFYQLAFPVTIIPFFFGGIVAFAIFLASRRSPEEETSRRLGGFFWAVLVAVAVGIAPIAGLDAMGVWTSNVMISESYTIAVPAALLFAAVVISWADGVSPDLQSLRSAKLTPSDILFLIVGIPFGIVLLGYLKISLMALAVAAAVYLVIRLGLYRRLPFLLSIVITAVVFYLTYVQVSLPAHREGLAPLDYLSNFVPLPWWPFFVLVHLAWTWIYAAYRIRQEEIQDLAGLGSAIKARRLIDVELLVAIALTGIVPGLLIHIDGGSAFYFSDVQRWLAGAMLLSWIASAGHKLWPRPTTTDKRGIGALPTRSLLIAFLLLAAAGSVVANAFHWPAIMIRQNVAVRQQLYANAGKGDLPGRLRDFASMRDPAVLAAGLRASPNYSLAHALDDYQRTPVSIRRREAMFIPQADIHYWTSLARAPQCTFQPFVAPALSGIAMIDGMPPAGCKLSKYYGIGSFTPRASGSATQDTTSAALCARAKAIGAEVVISIRFPGDSVIASSVQCGGALK